MKNAEAPPPPTELAGRALLVEDNAIIALNTEDMLCAMGFSGVDIAGSAAEALAYVQEHAYAAAIIDLKLPDGEATPAAKILAASNTPIVITSASTEIVLPPMLKNAPRLSKPYDEFTLRSAIIQAQQQTDRSR